MRDRSFAILKYKIYSYCFGERVSKKQHLQHCKLEDLDNTTLEKFSVLIHKTSSSNMTVNRLRDINNYNSTDLFESDKNSNTFLKYKQHLYLQMLDSIRGKALSLKQETCHKWTSLQIVITTIIRIARGITNCNWKDDFGINWMNQIRLTDRLTCNTCFSSLIVSRKSDGIGLYYSTHRLQLVLISKASNWIEIEKETRFLKCKRRNTPRQKLQQLVTQKCATNTDDRVSKTAKGSREWFFRQLYTHLVFWSNSLYFFLFSLLCLTESRVNSLTSEEYFHFSFRHLEIYELQVYFCHDSIVLKALWCLLLI